MEVKVSPNFGIFRVDYGHVAALYSVSKATSQLGIQRVQIVPQCAHRYAEVLLDARKQR